MSSPEIQTPQLEDRFYDTLPMGIVIGLIVAAAALVCLVGLIWAYRTDRFRKGQVHHTASTEITEEKLVNGLILQQWPPTLRDEDLTSQGTTDESAASVCALCSKPFQTGELTTRSHNDKCPHRFHKPCVANWLHLQNSCPTCNQVYMVEQEQEQV